MSAIKSSINLKMFVLVVVSLIAWIGVFAILYFVTNTLFDKVTENRGTPQAIVNSLQKYLEEEQVSTKDLSAIDIWCSRNPDVELDVFVDGVLTYSSLDDLSDNEYVIYESEQDKSLAFSLAFADRSADVLFYDYLHWYHRMLVIDMAAGVIVFLLIFIKGTSRSVARVVRLGREVQILEGGDLTQRITVQGNDEIAILAQSLEGFRESMVDKLETIRGLEKSNRQMSAEIAHDLRTPLTSLVMYLDFARNEVGEQNPQADYYLDKAREKSIILKNLMEDNFSFVSMNPGKSEELMPMQAFEVLNSLLGDLSTYLESEGFNVRADISYGQNNKIWINREAAGRVSSNLMSNMMKYASRSEEIFIGCKEVDKYLEVRLVNHIRVYEGDRPQSTGFGSRIVLRLMNGMKGEYIASEKDGKYETILRFLKA